MNELSPMIVVLLVPALIVGLMVGSVALNTLLDILRDRSEPASPAAPLEVLGTPMIGPGGTVAPRGDYLLRHLTGGWSYAFPVVGTVRVGRRPSVGGETLVIDAPTLSADHAEIIVEEGTLRILDLSRFGSWVNGRRATGSQGQTFGPGDELRFGDERFLCEECRPGEPPRRPTAGARDPGTTVDGPPEARAGRDDEEDEGIKVHWVR